LSANSVDHQGGQIVVVCDEGERWHLDCILMIWFQSDQSEMGIIMLSWALTFFIIAIVAAILGFGGIAGDLAWIAQVLLVVFLILAVVSMVSGRRSRSL
jgi:uncharacterized membrane protein YtjA (UPF0391 family)